MERAQLARAWVVLEEQKRILRGKLKPGSINGTMLRPQLKTARRGMVVDVEAVVKSLKRQELAAESVA